MSTSAGVPPQIPLKDFFRNPSRSSFRISPNGTYISYMEPWQKRMNIFVQKRGASQALRITSSTERDIPGHMWADDKRILFIQDDGGDENYRLYGVDVESGELKEYTPFDGVRVLLVDELREVPNKVLVSLNKRVKEVFDVYRLDTETGDMTLIAENPGNITGWFTDHDGKLRLAHATDGTNHSILFRDKEEDEFRPLLSVNFRDSVFPLFFDFDNRDFYAVSNRGRDRKAIVLIDSRDGSEKSVMYEHPEVDVSRLGYSDKRKVLTAISFTTWKRQYHFLDSRTEQLFQRLQKRFPNYEISVADMNHDETIYIIRTYSDRSLGAYYLYDSDKDELHILSEVSPWLKEEHLCPMRPIQFSSRDGFTVHGYLTMPLGRGEHNLPTVVVVHGGPWVRDAWGYNAEAQFLANRGYAVVQINYRGSTGYGRRFWEASFREWGGKMQDDISDGVQWLIEQGTADAERIAIYGGSYGGYAVLAGLCFTPDLYACGIDYVGVSNLLTFMKAIPPYWKPMREMMYEMIGNPEKDAEFLKQRSPVFNVDNIKAPLLVAQGAKDPRVNIDESNQIVEALRKRGIDVPYMVKENEGHGFHNEENRFEFYEAMETFLARHIGNQQN